MNKLIVVNSCNGILFVNTKEQPMNVHMNESQNKSAKRIQCIPYVYNNIFYIILEFL